MKERNIENRSQYKCQRNYCSNVLNQSQSDTLSNAAFQEHSWLMGSSEYYDFQMV